MTLVHGPGCPVCVTPLELIDRALAHRRAAGRDLRLLRRHAARARQRARPAQRASARGGDVRIVYSPLDALRARAAGTRSSEVVFFAVGFETTAPANAMAVWQRARAGLANFCVLVSHVLVPPGDGGDPGRARQPRAGVPGRRPRLRGHGLARVRAARRALPRARSSSPASSRSTSSRASTWRAAARGGAPARWRTSTRAPCAARATCPRSS